MFWYVLSFLFLFTLFSNCFLIQSSLLFYFIFFNIFIVVRAIYFFLSLTTWSDNNTPKYEGDFVLLVDTLPEIIFVAIYLLLVASWYDTRGGGRRKKIERERKGREGDGRGGDGKERDTNTIM